MDMKGNVQALLISTVLMFIIMFTQLSMPLVAATTSPVEAEKAEALIGVAKKASLRIEYVLNETKKTATDTNVTEAERLYEEGNALLSQAEVAIRERNYGDAVRLTINAMERFREARMMLAPTLEQVETEEGEFLKAQGLLVAAGRTLERIERLEELLPELQATLETAKNLLNKDEIVELLQEGKVSEVAHRIAEANRLICQALKSMAEEALPNKMERFMERLRERYEALIGRLQATGANAEGLLNEIGFRNTNELRESMQRLKEDIKSVGPKNAKDFVGQLMSLSNGLKRLESKTWSAPVTPSEPARTSALSVEIVEKRVAGNLKWVFLDVLVKNVGDVELRFQNSVYGLTIERKSESGTWELYYSPMSAQVIVFLKPGQVAHVAVRLNQPQPGEYRAHVKGICEQSGQLLEAVAEFSIP